MTDLLTVAIGIGLAISLLFSEMFGLAAGGMVVPGGLPGDHEDARRG